MTVDPTSSISDLQECLAGSITASHTTQAMWGHILAQVKHIFKIKIQVPLKNQAIAPDKTILQQI